MIASTCFSLNTEWGFESSIVFLLTGESHRVNCKNALQVECPTCKQSQSEGYWQNNSGKINF